jgi:hypothetical protein
MHKYKRVRTQKSKTRPNAVFSLRFIVKKRFANKEDAFKRVTNKEICV